MTGECRVLIVDDEASLADLYAAWLADDHSVGVAYSGREALEKIDPETDVVFLDRRMPELSGDEVLERVRGRGFDGQIVLITAVRADFDVLELEFDEYLSKPVLEEDLRATVDRFDRRSEYDETVQEYFSLTARRAALEADTGPEQRRSSEAYAELLDEMAALEAHVEDQRDQLDERDAAVLADP